MEGLKTLIEMVIIKIIIALIFMLILPFFNVLINIVVRAKQKENTYRNRDIIINNFYLFFIIFGALIKLVLSFLQCTQN